MHITTPTPDTIHLIETVRVNPGRTMPLITQHLGRLQRSCDALGYPWPATLAQHIAAHTATLEKNTCYRLRILVNPRGGQSLQTQTLAALDTPVRVHLAEQALEANFSWIHYKSTYRPWYAQASVWLEQHPECFDVLYCNARDEVCEGSRSNVYICDEDGQWLTPPLDCGLLPGVQRQVLLEQGLVHEAVITRTQLRQARQVRVSNALRGWLDVVLV